MLLHSDTRLIPLAQGRFAIVDSADYEQVAGHKWYLHKSSCEHFYVRSGGTNALYMHRFLLKAPSDREVDHINHNGLDNRRCNLRLCSHKQNQQHQPKWRKSCSSRFIGVCWMKDQAKWRAYITIDGKRKHLGVSDSEEAAALMYNAAAREYHGAFACLNTFIGQAP